VIKITTTDRNGGIAIWVDYDGDFSRNIWDISKEEATPAVLNAIKSAVKIGMEIHKQSVFKAMQAIR
jgi:hypothetical protein